MPVGVAMSFDVRIGRMRGAGLRGPYRRGERGKDDAVIIMTTTPTIAGRSRGAERGATMTLSTTRRTRYSKRAVGSDDDNVGGATDGVRQSRTDSGPSDDHEYEIG